MEESESISPFLSTPRFLIQFNLRKITHTNFYIGKDSLNTATRYDTASVEVIELTTKKLIQIDKFCLDFKVLKKGTYPDSSDGLKMYLSIDRLSEDDFFEKDTLVEGERYKISPFNIKGKDGNDSLNGSFFWTDKTGFSSIFDFEKPHASKLNFIGFSLRFVKENFKLEARVSRPSSLGPGEMKKYNKILKKLSLYL